MTLHASVTDHALDLPSLYRPVILSEAGDAFEHACAIAGEKGAGTLVWVQRSDAVEFAVVLEPEMPLEQARLALYIGMNALADALATHAPPSRPITFGWPDTICVDGTQVGGGRLGWPEGSREDAAPAWLVFSATIRTTIVRDDEPGLRPLVGALDEVGFEALSSGAIIASFSRHLMNAFDHWNEAGFAPIARQWLERFSPNDQDIWLTDDGDLLLSKQAGEEGVARRVLAEAILSPSWLAPATRMP